MSEPPAVYRSDNVLHGGWRQRALRLDGEVAGYRVTGKPETQIATIAAREPSKRTWLLRVLPFRLIDDDA